MKNRLLRLLLPMLVVAGYHVGVVTAAHAQNPPPPALDYFPDKWDEYISQEGKFRIRFPKKPIESVDKQERYDIHLMEYKGLLYYQVSYVDYKVSVDGPQNVRAFLRAVKTATLNAIPGNDIRIVADREVVVDGHHGVFVNLEVGAKEVIRMQLVAAGTRFYIISATSRKGSANELEGKDDFLKVAMGFIDSFHVLQ